jgi:CheY-like chemotaxis protein
VLVADDNETSCTVLRQYLKSWSLDVQCVGDGEAALSALRSAAADGVPFDGVVLDMNMPGLTGVQVAQAVLADPVLADTPMAVLTSSNVSGDAERARQAGVTVYLAKPVREAALYEAVSRLLGTSPAERRRAAPAVQRSQNGHRILVVEDNAVNQQVVVAMLAALGYPADVAVDGQHALELFSAGAYAAVLMDCQMPRMDGYAATRRLRQDGGRGAEVPVIALTASALAEDEQRCRDAGMDDFMTKPLRPETLGRVLGRWLPDAALPGVDLPGADLPGADLPGADTVADPLDRTYLTQLQALGPVLLGGIVSTFLDGVPERLAELRLAVDEGDGREVSRLAHTLRGSAAYVAAPTLADLCGGLEAAGASGSASTVALLAEVEAELDRVARELRVVVENTRSQAPSLTERSSNTTIS